MNKGFSDQFSPPLIAGGKHYLYLFLLWPFMAFVMAIINFSQKEAKKVVYIFLVYYGLTFIIGVEGMDAAGYAQRLRDNAMLPFSDFFNIVGGIYTSDTSVDIVEPLISFLVSRFTEKHSILFAVYAAVFAFFYLKSIDLLYSRYSVEKPGRNAWILLAFFVTILPVTSINGFRMWTAAWIFFYGAYHVIIYRNPRYLLVALAASLVHFSFLSANIILVIWFLAGNRNFIYMPLALASFVVPQIISPFIQMMSLRLGGGLQGRVESYTSEGYILFRQEDYANTVWFLQVGNTMVFYFLILAIAIIQFRTRNTVKDKPESNLYSFLLLFLAFVNFGKPIPSFGGRFEILFFMFASLYVFLYFVKQAKSKLDLINWIGLFPMFLYAVIVLRQGSETINAWILSPGFGVPLFVKGISVAGFLF